MRTAPICPCAQRRPTRRPTDTGTIVPYSRRGWRRRIELCIASPVPCDSLHYTATVTGPLGITQFDRRLVKARRHQHRCRTAPVLVTRVTLTDSPLFGEVGSAHAHAFVAEVTWPGTGCSQRQSCTSGDVLDHVRARHQAQWFMHAIEHVAFLLCTTCCPFCYFVPTHHHPPSQKPIFGTFTRY